MRSTMMIRSQTSRQVLKKKRTDDLFAVVGVTSLLGAASDDLHGAIWKRSNSACATKFYLWTEESFKLDSSSVLETGRLSWLACCRGWGQTRIAPRISNFKRSTLFLRSKRGTKTFGTPKSMWNGSMHRIRREIKSDSIDSPLRQPKSPETIWPGLT